MRANRFRNADDFDAHLGVKPGVCNIDLFDAPDPDPAIGRAAEANAQIGQEMVGIAREQWDAGKALIDRYAPVYERLINANADLAESSAQRSDAQWADYDQIFRPIERQFAADAMNYDSPEEIGRREALAAGTVQTQFDAARDQNARRMAAMGVSADSGRGVQGGIEDTNTLALAKAGAINKERNDTKIQGIAMRQSAAQFGRNQVGTSIAQNAAALQGNQGASNTIGSQTAQSGAALQPAGSMYSGAVGANNASGNLALGQYNSQVAAQGNAADAFGSMVGLGLGAYSAFKSDENAKKDVEGVDDEEALEAMRMTPVKEWTYEEGQGDGERHVGPMAQDVNATMGNEVAPGGKVIDPISYMGAMHASIRALDKKVAKLTKRKARGIEDEDVDYDDPSLMSLQPLRI
jgi:hypothetical protein